MAVDGHPFSLILVLKESTYVTSYKRSMVVTCIVSEIWWLQSRKL